MLQFDVCCKAIDQNFDCSFDRYAILYCYIIWTQHYEPHQSLSSAFMNNSIVLESIAKVL